MTQNAKTTTIIIPLRMSDLVYQAPKRLNLILSKVPADLFDVIVVDYGSQSPFREEILEISNRYDHSRVVRVDAEFDSFSIGAARDIGVQHATTPVVMFNDIDFYANDVMYRRIDDEIKSRELTTKTYDFFCVPVAWTTDLVLNLIDEMPDRNFNYTIHQSIIEYAKSMEAQPSSQIATTISRLVGITRNSTVTGPRIMICYTGLRQAAQRGHARACITSIRRTTIS